MRQDLQILRAIAVALVILFHFQVPGFHNGFVGVDVFFVISGYLITQQLNSMSERGETALLFFKRRIKRLIPAQVFIIFVTFVLAIWLGTEAQFTAFKESALASAGQYANFYFAANSSYWDLAAHAQPLLHLWSLGVEWQIYIVLAVLVFSFRRRTVIAILALSTLSFAALIPSLFDATQAFYWPFGRFWEFGMGALLALLHPPLAKLRRIPFLTVFAYIAFIAALVVLNDFSLSFPLPYALLPVLFTGFVIALGNERAYPSLTPVAYVGDISYSLYLIHWPLWVFVGEFAPWGSARFLLLLTATFAIGAFSYHYVENAFRRRGEKTFNIEQAAALALLLSLMGWGLHERANLNDETGAGDPDLLASPMMNIKHFCHQGWGVCGALGRAPDPTVLVAGDSHAYKNAPGIGDQLFREKRRAAIASLPGCPPVLNVARILDPTLRVEDHPCIQHNKEWLDTVVKTDIETVILVAFWAGGIGESFDDYLVARGEHARPDENGRLEVLDSALRETIGFLTGHGKKVVIYGAGPYFAKAPTSCVEAPAFAFMACERDARDPRLVAEINSRFQAIASEFENVSVFAFYDALCTGAQCMTRDGQRSLFIDTNHFSRYGSIWLSRRTGGLPMTGTDAQ